MNGRIVAGRLPGAQSFSGFPAQLDDANACIQRHFGQRDALQRSLRRRLDLRYLFAINWRYDTACRRQPPFESRSPRPVPAPVGEGTADHAQGPRTHPRRLRLSSRSEVADRPRDRLADRPRADRAGRRARARRDPLERTADAADHGRRPGPRRPAPRADGRSPEGAAGRGVGRAGPVHLRRATRS